MSDARGPLRSSRDFRLLLAGQTTSQFGTQIAGVAVPLLAVITLEASPFEVGMLGAASTIAFALIGLPAGAWLDRMRRRPVLVASDLARAVLLATIPAAAWFGWLTMAHLLVVSFLVGTARVFFDVGYQSYVPTITGRDRVLAGNSAMEFLRSGGQVAGPGIGGALVSLAGAANVVLLQAIGFVVSAVTLAGIRAVETSHDPTAHSGTMWVRVRAGFRFVVHHRVLRATALASAASNLSFAIASAVTFVFLSRDLGQPAWILGLLIAAGSVAVMVGAALTPRLARTIGSARVIWVSLAVTTPFVLLVPAATPGWGLAIALLGFAAGELGQIVYSITNVSLRQRLTPDHLLGRVNATMRFLIMAFFPAGALLGGVLGELIGTRWTLVVAGAVALTAPVVLVRALRRHRDVEEFDPLED
ncbi:MFS transporter [Labedella populi]|uniref:MFS transporter n=1 Tax=Labedella populi TaxID=2498850 RepID=A0A3S5CJ66_9MICO|nr:MFS transporter [Labedella populi]RWZ59625.1 MFS transporter [Labedella populi]